MRVDNNKEVLDIENCWNMDNLGFNFEKLND